MQKNKSYNSLPIIVLLFIFLVDFILIVLIHWQWHYTMQKYLPLQNDIQIVKNDLSKAHLWLEEAIGGDPFINIEKDVIIPFQHRSFNLYMKHAKSILTKKEDEPYLLELQDIDRRLTDLHAIAKYRLEKSKVHGIGSDLDQVFDKKFNNLLKSIDKFTVNINQRIEEELTDRQYFFSWVLLFFIFINIFMFSMMIKYKRRQQKDQFSLYEEKERAVVTLSSIGDAVITTDVDGNITFFNNVAETLTEYTNEEVQGLAIDSVLNLYDIKTGKKIITPITEVIHKGTTKLISDGTKLISKTGKEYILRDSVAAVKSKNGDILGTVLVFKNDTERYKMQKILKDSESKYRNLVENVKNHYFFYVHDMNGIFTYVSNSITNILGYSKKEFETNYLTYLTNDPMNDKVDELTQKCMQGEQQRPYNISIYHSNGTVRYLEVLESPVYNTENQVIAVEGVARNITENYLAQQNIKEQKELLNYRAHHDILTNLPNRQLFLDRLSQSIKYAQRFGNKIAVLFIDLDHFKEINDSLGHYIGDEVLMSVSIKLSEQIRETDTLARLGGDEFILMLDTLHDDHFIIDMVQKLTDTMNEPILAGEHQVYLTLSIGVSLYPDDANHSEDLLRNADAAMYKAKDNGRNTYCFYTEEMTQKAFERIEMETSLRQALEKEEFVVYYHAQMDGITDTIVGLEALIRWKHPTMGLLEPDVFIPLAEEIGLIIPLDRWMMKTAMLQFLEWYKEGLNPTVVSLNLSIKQIRQPDFITMVSSLLEETGCKAEYISFEITETQIMVNPEQCILILQELNDLGIKLAIDDFGTGYSSLSYLKELPISKLKIDKSFIKGLPDNIEDAGIVKAVIILSKSLNLDIIAEGVETPEQKKFLVDNGCKDIQGFVYAKPKPASEMKNYLENLIKQ